METIKILKRIALTVEKDSIVKIDKKQLELLDNYKDYFILTEGEESKDEAKKSKSKKEAKK